MMPLFGNYLEIERLLLNHEKMPGFLASRGEEFDLGPETRLDCSELLCNRVLLKYKRDRKVSDIDIRRGQKEYSLASVINGVIYSPIIQRMSEGCKDLTRPTPIIYILK